jgi:uncharacterized phage-associated protein
MTLESNKYTNVGADAKAVANKLLDWADADGIPVSPMKLQKLVFFPHADFLVNYGKPLVRQDFEAWDYGPVIPSLYAEFKHWKDARILSRARAFNPANGLKITPILHLAPDEMAFLRDRFAYYRDFSAVELSRMSHNSDGAWRQARSLFANGLNMDRRISNQLIQRLHRFVPN